MTRLWDLFVACAPGMRRESKIDWIEVDLDGLRRHNSSAAQGRQDQESSGEESDFVEIESVRDSVPTSPVPTVCSPASSLYVCKPNDIQAPMLRPRPRKQLPNPEPAAPSSVLSVRALVSAYERQHQLPIRPLSPPKIPTEAAVTPIEPVEEPLVVPDVEHELRKYQAMKRRAKFDQRAQQSAEQRRRGGSRYRSPSYPPSYILNSPFRSLQ